MSTPPKSRLDTHSAIEQVPIEQVRPNPNNVKVHSDKNLAPLADMIRRVGLINPLVTDETWLLLAGHGRLEVARRMGYTTVPVIRVSHLNEAEKVAYALGDNRLAELADIDREMLSGQLKFLIKSKFEIATTGFSIADADFVIGTANPVKDDGGIIFAGLNETPVTRPGDLWFNAQQTLLCADTRDKAEVARALDGRTVQMGFCDPPYSISVSKISGGGKVRHREFLVGSGEQSDQEYVDFLTRVMTNMVAFSDDGSIHYWCSDWRCYGLLDQAAMSVYSRKMNLCVWYKTNGGQGSFYRSQHELIPVYKVGAAKHICNFGLGDKGKDFGPNGKGRYRTNVWRAAGANTFRKGRMEDLETHPTCKSIPLVAEAILDCSNPGGLVFDGFCGSGVTLIAAHHTGRVGVGIEIDPIYVDASLRRLEKATDCVTYHADGDTFAEKARKRAAGEE